MIKEWKDIPGFPDFQASPSGDIRRKNPARGSFVGNGILGSKDGKGYLVTRLKDESGKYKKCRIHRLIASTYLPNPNNFPQINHINTIKTDNRLSNLEWCNNRHNANHAKENGLLKKSFLGKFGKDHNRSIPIKAINIDTGETRNFIGINETARQLNTNSVAIWRVMSGEYKHSKRWKFERV